MPDASRTGDRDPAGVIHDLTNALGAADGLLELLEDGVLDPLTSRQREAVDRARRSMASALRLTAELAERDTAAGRPGPVGQRRPPRRRRGPHRAA